MKIIYILIFHLILFNSSIYSQSKIKFNEKGVISDKNDQYLLASLKGVATDLENNIYLFDFTQNSVFKLNQNEDLIGKIIRPGRGPAEINSIYSYYLDNDTERIYIADRQNFQFLITDLEGDEIETHSINPSFMNTPMGMQKYNENILAFLFYNSQEQLMRKNNGIDSLIHFYDVESFERLYSIADRSYINKLINYKSKSAALVNKTFVGEILFSDENTLLYSPYIFNKSILVFKKINTSEWKFEKKLKSKEWDTESFIDIDYQEFRMNREKYRGQGQNVVTSSGPDGKGAGIMKLRSVGIFKDSNNYIVNFVVKENPYETGFEHVLFAEIYSNDLVYLGSSKIYKAKKDEIIRYVSWKDIDDNFYLNIEGDRYSTHVVKFQLDIDF
ncbi:6-bladed beta-propeller [Gracilimonas sp.]|uniref:6-bladed beta-propeller n=1 Tax=Gracilimonas sp. TaxID=1974203 RepID=UPI0028726D74|nr:6-bladed beta-propeller [Gracilimonas sp.]